MKRYAYVIVGTDLSTVWSRVVAMPAEKTAPGVAVEHDDEEDDEPWTGRALAMLLSDGWRPVRETAMGGDSGYACSLLLLEKE